MSRIELITASRAETVVEGLYKDMERRITASPPDICPVDLTSAFLKMCLAQSCGKCTPCRVGLARLSTLLDSVTAHTATMKTLEEIETLAKTVSISADCAIGIESAKLVLKGLDGFRDDYISHIQNHHCLADIPNRIPCVANCPAGVDIPGYVALVKEGRYADAVRLIRKDNPFVSSCALVCEHPCESRCRRTLLDAPINIRGLKRVAVERAGEVPAPECMPSTGKKVAVIGAGPSGMTAAYYLQLMGHQVTVYEKHKRPGGMLAYGIPAYRLPREILEQDLNMIISTGVEVHMETEVGKGEYTLEKLRKQYDAIFIAIGAHQDRKAGVEGEDADGVLSAVEFLGNIGDGLKPNFRGKRVCVIGGGNVAMDCTRSAIRLGAETSIVYRRRKEDMTALPEEVEGAIAEGAIMRDMCTPLRIEKNEKGHVAALWVTPMMVGKIKGGRMNAGDSGKDPIRIPCDYILVAVGQDIDSQSFASEGIPVSRGVIQSGSWTEIEGHPGVFAGGDCATGPKTAVRAIAAGKVAADNIDHYLGFNHYISSDIVIPEPSIEDRDYCGRVNMAERDPADRISDFKLMEILMTEKESCQEAGRCLRCDQTGCGNFRGGRVTEW